MLDIVNRYVHGYVAVPVMLACQEKDVFALLQQDGPMTLEQMAVRLGANSGHLQAALRMLQSLQWLIRDRTGAYTLSADAASHGRIPPELLDLYHLDMDTYLLGEGGLLAQWIERSQARWHLADPLLADFLDGVFIVPLLLALQKQDLLAPQPFAALRPGIRQELTQLFVHNGWAQPRDHHLALTDAGSYLVDRALVTGIAASYRPMLARMADVLFGDPEAVFGRDDSGHEQHLDRTLNVIASGFQHERFFADLDAIILSIFNRPIAEQPNYVADMGCGDGSLLKRVYDIIRDKSARGRVLDTHPLSMIGVDFNEASLSVTARTLADVPHVLLQGDIGDPERMIASLQAHGIDDPENILHIRSFLDHDRPFVQPRNMARAEARSRLPYHGVYVDSSGQAIPPHLMVQSLIDHLQRWAAVVGKHGLIILEVHCLEPEIVAKFLDLSESFHFDAYQAFSMQYLVEADVFLMAAAEAGLFTKFEFSKRYPRTFPFTRITLNAFEKRPYTIRHPEVSDLSALVDLEVQCWPSSLQTPASEIRQRIERFPHEHCVLEMNGRVAGVIYSQRISNIDALEQINFKMASSLHDAPGTIVQLLALNVLPEVQHYGLGDQLLEFMLQYVTLKSGIDRVVGVTRCRNFADHPSLSMEAYIEKRDDGGKIFDPVLHFHESHGAQIRRVVEGYYPSDAANEEKGVFIEYDLRNRERAGSRGKAVGKTAAEAQPISVQVEEAIRSIMDAQRQASFSPELPLMEMGLESLELLELRTLLNQRFGLELEPTFFFRHGTPAAITQYLQTMRSADGTSTAAIDNMRGAQHTAPGADNPRLAASQPSDTSCSTAAVWREINNAEDAVAIIGMACRFPGDIQHPDDYWALLRDGVDAITEIPKSRWDNQRYHGEGPGKINTAYGGFLSQVDQFDAPFFRIAPIEAEALDPQQRILLEASWEALEHACINPASLAGSQTGVFVGIFSHDYELLQAKQGSAPSAYFGTGNSVSVAAGRLSYFFGFQGPALAVDTACSSSLVSVHLACQSLLQGECELALASGVNLLLSPDLSITFSQAGMLAPDGRCKTFDARANGYVRSEGCGVVVLKRLSEALEANDNILAVVRGTAINQDGASNGLTAPNELAQEAVIRQALAKAGVAPHEVSYVEAHGTGTPLGDPIEVEALGAVYGKDRAADNPLVIGSVKTNIGHTEGTAGMAGLLKVVLSLQHGYIPPHLHFSEPNPLLSLDQIPALIPAQGMAWKAPGRRIAGVSSFGFSGTNAHVIVEEMPPRLPAQAVEGRGHLLTLSAKSETALRHLAGQYAQHLSAHPELSIADVCWTANTGRAHFDHRLAAVATSIPELCEQLSAVADGMEASTGARGYVTQRPKVAFLFTGQGSQYIGMGRQLYDTQPVFRHALDECSAILRPRLGTSLLDVLYPEGEVYSPINETAYTQPALFALEYALAMLWQSWGITPDVVMGHSVGEYVAACVAGVFSLQDGLRLIAERGRLMQSLPQNGDMVAVLASEAQVAEVLAPYAQTVSIAAINGPTSVVLSGERQAVQQAVEALPQEVRTTKLSVSHAFHSPLMEPILADFARVASEVRFSSPQLNLISNVSGDLVAEEVTDPDYWTRHIREAVRFADGMLTLGQMACDVLVEAGPQPTLLGLGRSCLPDHGGGWLPSLRPGRSDNQQLLESLAALYARGSQVEWAAIDPDLASEHGKVSLPTYPFERQHFWLPSTQSAQTQNGHFTSHQASHNLLGQRLQSALQQSQFEAYVSQHAPEYLADYRVFDTSLLPTAGYVEIALAAAQEVFTSEPVLEHLVIRKALFLRPDDATKLQCILTPETGRQYGFQLFSLSASASKHGKADQTAWTLHATGQLRLADDADTTAQAAITSGLASVQTRLRDELLVTDYYQRLREQGIELGPSFQTIRRLWHSAGQANAEALAQIELPDNLSPEGYTLHPVLLEACFHMLGNPLGMAANGQSQDTLLPMGLEGLRLYGRPASRTMWCHIRVSEDGTDRVGDLHLFDDNGTLVAELSGLLLRRATRVALLRESGLYTQNMLYEVEWQAKPKPPQDRHPDGPGSWLIFADAGEVAAGLVALLADRGERCVLVHPGESYQRAGDVVTLNPAEPADFQRLFNLDEAELAYPYRGIVHLWSLRSRDVSHPIETARLWDAQVMGCGSVLHLIQALTTVDMPPPRLCLVTRGAQAVGPAQHQLEVQQAPLWGLAQVIRLEHPRLQTVCLDLSLSDRDGDAKDIQALFEDIWSPDAEEQIAYRAAARQVARLTRLMPEPAADTASPSSPLIASSGKSYLITGGFGGLGLQVASFLVEQGARHLILTGRRGADSEAREAIVDLEQRGATVVAARADVSRQEDVQNLLAEMHPPLGGIIHAAGTLDDGLLDQQSLSSFEKVMASKVLGTWNLHALTQDMPLDFFVCFSSVASLLGLAGQGNYAAANAFMDAVAHHRRALGLPALSINWGPWAEAGMAASLSFEAGMDKLEPEAGLQIFAELVLQNAHPQVSQVGAVPLNWSQFRQPDVPDIDVKHAFLSQLVRQAQPAATAVAGTGDAAKLAVQASIQQRFAEAAPSERQELLATYIREQVGQILRLSSSQSLPPTQPLHEFGMDSLLGVELKNRLEGQFQVVIPIRRILRDVSIRMLTDLIFERLEDAAGEAVETSQATAPGSAGETWGETNLMTELEPQIPQLHALVEAQHARQVWVKGRWATDFASCNYLGLDLHPDVMAAIPAALQKWGVHPSWSRKVASPGIYDELEQELASLVGAPGVLVFPSLSLLHLGVIPILAGYNGVIFKDMAAHRSVYEGCRQAQTDGAEWLEFRHNDAVDLERKLAQYAYERTKLIAIDGVYSMSGIYPPLHEYVRLAKKYNATIYMDDAHGFGIVGENPTPEMPYGYKGNGLVQHFGLRYGEDRIIYVAGLSKAYSSYGAFITCADEETKHRLTGASTFMFSGPSPVASLASALAGLKANREEGGQWRQQIYDLTRKLVSAAKAMGFEVRNDNDFPIVSVVVGPPEQVVASCEVLWEFGALITPALYPVVPIDQGLLRFSITSANTEQEIDQVIQGLQAVWEMLQTQSA